MTAAPAAAPDCPACGAALEPRGRRFFCDACRGVMVTRDELRAMLREIHPEEKRSLEQQLVPLAGAGAGARTCPHCGARMDAFALNRVPIDQCFTHGFWFDRDELAAVLQGDTSPEEFEAENEDRYFIARDPVTGSAIALARKLFYWLRRKRQDAALRAKPPRT
jgi:Zn-finger nucleic acid-binding protein